MPPGYRAEYSECDEGTYWHLYRRGVKVNGGLARDGYLARTDAYRYACLDQAGPAGPWVVDIDAIANLLSHDSVVAAVDQRS